MLPGCLVAGFFELADEVLEDRPHAVIVHGFKRQIGVGKRLRNLEQQPLAEQRLVDRRQPLLLAAREVEQDVLDVDGEAVEVRPKVRPDVGGKLQQPGQRILRRVVERLSGRLLEQRIASLLRRGLVLRGSLADGVASRFQHTIKAAQQRERQDDVLIVLGFVVVLDEVRNFPKEFRDLGMVLHSAILFVGVSPQSIECFLSLHPRLPRMEKWERRRLPPRRDSLGDLYEWSR